jgi:hypothetical protein
MKTSLFLPLILFKLLNLQVVFKLMVRVVLVIPNSSERTRTCIKLLSMSKLNCFKFPHHVRPWATTKSPVMKSPTMTRKSKSYAGQALGFIASIIPSTKSLRPTLFCRPKDSSLQQPQTQTHHPSYPTTPPSLLGITHHVHATLFPYTTPYQTWVYG